MNYAQAFLFLSLFAAAALHAQEVSAGLSSNQVAVGQPAQILVIVRGARAADVPHSLSFSGLSINLAGRSTEIEMRNFKMSTTLTYTYNIVPRSAGDLNIPSIGVEIAGKTFHTQPMNLSVFEPDPEAGKFRERFAKKCSEVFARLAEALLEQINSNSPTLSGAVLKLDPAGGKATDWIEIAFATELLEAKEKPAFASAIQSDKQFAFSSLDLLQILPLASEKRFSNAAARLLTYLRPPGTVLPATSDAARSAFAGLQGALDEQIKKSNQIRQQSNQEAGKQNYDRASELLREAMKIDLRDQDTETLNQYSKNQKKKAYKEEIGL